MAPEVQKDYVKEAQLNDTNQLEVDILKDSSKFNEADLRKQYKERLDAVVGKKIVPDSLWKKYTEALKKIDENIAKLKEVRDYSAAKANIKTLDRRYNNLKLDIKNPVQMLNIEYDVKALREFNEKKWGNVLLMIDKRIIQGEIDKTIGKVGGVMDNYFADFAENAQKDQMARLKAAPTESASINDYDSLKFEYDYVGQVMDDIGQFASAGRKTDLQISLNKKKLEMKSVLDASFPKLSKADQFVMSNLEKAEKAYRKNEKGGKEWFNGAVELNAMTLAKSNALNKKKEIVDAGAMGGLLADGDVLFKQAEAMSKKNYLRAEEFYKKATGKYEFSRAIMASSGSFKKPVAGGNDKLATN